MDLLPNSEHSVSERRVWKRGWKRPLSEAQIQARRKEGEALFTKYGSEHFSKMAKKGGGRPTFWAALEKAKSREANAAASRPSLGRVRQTKEDARLVLTLPGEV